MSQTNEPSNSLKRAAIVGGLMGFVVPVVFSGLFLMLSLIPGSYRTTAPIGILTVVLALAQYALWPTQVLLIPFSGAPWPQVVPMLTLSIGANVAIYVFVTIGAGLLRRRRQAPKYR
jgi:hypothetical protein